MTIWLSPSALTTAMQTFGLLWFCSWLFPERLALPRNIFLKALLFLFADMAVCLCIYLATRLFPDQGMVYAFGCTLLFQFAACQILFEGSGFFKFFNLLFANVYFTGVLMVSLFAADTFVPLRVHRTPLLYAVYINVLPQLAAILALIPLFRRAVRTRFKTSPPRYYWLYACLIYLALYFGLMYTIDALPRRGNAQALSVLLEAVLLLMSVVFYLMFLSICDGYHEKIRHSLIEQQVQLQKAHLTESQAAGKALKELRHELKNYMFYMNYLIDQGDFEKLRSFFADFYQKEHRNLYEVSGSENFLDAVLQQKFTTARALGIEVDDHVLLPDGEILNNLDLCIVLSNLLDNAIEACRGLSGPSIAIQLRQVKEYVSLVVRNSAAQDVLKNNPLLRTGKLDKELHGIGLQVIRDIVERYEGSISFESDSTAFTVMLMMKMPLFQTRAESEGTV